MVRYGHFPTLAHPLVLPVLHEVVDHGRIGRGRGVAEAGRFVLGDLAQDAAHDLAGARLGQAGRELDQVRRCDRADALADPGDQLLAQRFGRLSALHQRDIGIDALALDVVRVADDGGFRHRLMRDQRTLWRQNPSDKIVVFATYLGTVDMIAREIEQTFPGQGVVVLRGGDHRAKVAAERRFRQKDGPRVLVCTAAGREGINLQFARILFSFDLPWNPMDMEQRIGRIHRYGQRDTAQVYHLVLSDTIEGRIFLLLDEKLTEIARTVGKVDEQGNAAEDLQAQILGQLSERLNDDRLYQEALSDPELKRTQVELEAALSNSREARQVVFDLFQDLDGFSLDDYKPSRMSRPVWIG